MSVGSIVCSFGLGVLLAVWLWNDHAVGNRLGFVLFIGAAMSITAFPVLARILTDRGIQGGFNRSSQHLDRGGVRWDGRLGGRRR
ncbi:hypothetical protein [Streptomyces hypolithicus]